MRESLGFLYLTARTCAREAGGGYRNLKRLKKGSCQTATTDKCRGREDIMREREVSEAERAQAPQRKAEKCVCGVGAGEAWTWAVGNVLR